jgi:hypothetical protein
MEERGIGMGISSKLGNLGVVTTTVEQAVNWGRTGAMWPLLFGLACCAIEMMAGQASDYDMSRFGMELNRATPRQSDLAALGGNDWFNWKGSAQSKDVAVIGIPPAGWINFISAGQDTAPPTNALMTSIQSQLFNAGGLGIRLGVGGGGTFFGEPGARITSFRFSNNIPEPSSLILLGFGVVGCASSRVRRRL